MLVFPECELAILTPPHVASQVLHEVLPRTHGAICYYGPTPDGAGYDHHCTAVHNGMRHYRRAVVVRHPLDRLVGLWLHHVFHQAVEHGCGTADFAQFVGWVHANNRNCLSWMYRYTICRWLGDAPYDDVILYENLEEGLSSLLGSRVELVDRRNRRRSWQEYYGDETRELASAWAADDFSRFRYPVGNCDWNSG